MVVLRGLRRLATALLERDPDAAARAMSEHLTEAIRILRELVGKQREPLASGSTLPSPLNWKS
jgi:DNA-binding FadR family transcriptional regulator